MRLVNPSPLILGLCLLLHPGALQAESGTPFITYDNQPQGTLDKPLILRTYFPDPGLGREVMAHHDLGVRARKYKPGKGDVEGFDDPIRGIPGAIGVSFGPDLSYCWDATECRLLYAWQGGFLDMKRYWGDPESGQRKRFGYVPELVGPIIYMASGSDPLAILDHFTDTSAPVYKGYALKDGIPVFEYEKAGCDVAVTITPGEKPMEIHMHYVVKGTEEGADYADPKYDYKLKRESPSEFTVILKGTPMGEMKSEETGPKFTTDKPNDKWGEALYTNLGCFACHTTDGTRGHGPSFSGLWGAERPITGQEPVMADEAYIRESIVNPTAKVVDTYPPGYMPPYPLEENQVKSIILFIQGLESE